MSVQPAPRMTVDEFLAWADGRDGKYELVDGEVVAMAPERVRHAEVKFAVCAALKAEIRKRTLPCRALVDGVAVRIDARTSYVPDALAYCGDPVDPDAMEIPAPVIVVEVVSPSSTSIDTNRKLAGYFRVPNIIHYLVVEPTRPMVIHHRRLPDDTLEIRIVSTGAIDLAPPGLRLTVEDLLPRP